MVPVYLEISGKKYEAMVKQANVGSSNCKPYVSFNEKFESATSYEENNRLGLKKVLEELSMPSGHNPVVNPSNFPHTGNTLHITVRHWATVVKPGQESPMLSTEQNTGRTLTLNELSEESIEALENAIVEEAYRWSASNLREAKLA